MKVVCINNKELGGNGPKEQLIVGQIYEIKEYEDDSSMCYIIGFGDKGNKDNGFLKKRFITLKEYRKQKLNKLNENR